MNAFTLHRLQEVLPWNLPYSEAFEANMGSHKHMVHALHHIQKAAGQLHAICDDMDHGRTAAAHWEENQKYVADLVICALRIAKTFPYGAFDLEQAVVRRMETKNSVKLEPPGAREAGR